MRRSHWKLWATVVLVVGTFVATIFSDNRPELGLDLQGGISVVLFPVDGSDLSTLDTAVEIISSRVNALGVNEPEVNRQGDTIVIDLPGAKDREEALALVGRTAELRFRPVLGFVADESVIEEASTTTAEGGSTTSGAPGETTTTAEGATTTAAPGDTTTTASGETTTTVEGATTTAAPGDTTTTTVEPPVCSELITPREEDIANQQVILPTKPGESADRAGCYELGPAVLTGKSVRGAKARYDGAQGGWLVEVEFKGNDFVEKVAVPYAEQLVAIVLDGAVYSAPNIQPGITGSDVQITGSFSEREAKDLALVLRYGALPVQFDKEQETVQSVSPTLGKDQLRAGIVAGLIGLALVALYMILYYRILGLVVWLGLALTGLFFFTLVSFLSAQIGLAMTLAGVTGLIVSVGVTVDSYVVYFERLKDEVRTGKTIRSSVDVGFTRAFRTILAADLVSLLGAGVLYMLAIGSVRGFAFFLGVSTVIDLVIAYFFMHPLVSMMARRPSLVRMRGLGIAVGLDVPEARA